MGDGFLAIWSDIEPAAETDYLHWMTREHAIERVGIPGFLAMRMFRALDVDARRYFILYELENAGVVGGPEYLARLNQPTPWSQRIMPQLRNFARGGGHVAAASGTGRGGFIAPLRLDAAAAARAAEVAAAAAKIDRVASVRVLATDHAQTSIQTREKGMRAGDRSFDGLLLVEGVDAASVRAAIDLAVAKLEMAGPIDRAVYATIFALDRRLLKGVAAGTPA
jgi:hypothetical protein